MIWLRVVSFFIIIKIKDDIKSDTEIHDKKRFENMTDKRAKKHGIE